jgi:hypothetical protein
MRRVIQRQAKFLQAHGLDRSGHPSSRQESHAQIVQRGGARVAGVGHLACLIDDTLELDAGFDKRFPVTPPQHVCQVRQRRLVLRLVGRLYKNDLSVSSSQIQVRISLGPSRSPIDYLT